MNDFGAGPAAGSNSAFCDTSAIGVYPSETGRHKVGNPTGAVTRSAVFAAAKDIAALPRKLGMTFKWVDTRSTTTRGGHRRTGGACPGRDRLWLVSVPGARCPTRAPAR